MKRPIAVVCAIVLSFVSRLTAQTLVVTPDHADGVYAVGDDVKWTVAYKTSSTTAPAAPAEVKYTIKQNGLKPIKEETLALADGKGTVAAKFDAPGTLLLVVRGTVGDAKEIKGLGGAAADWQKITPSMPRPDDFDAFWQDQIDKLAKIAPNPQLEKGEAGKDGVDYFKITMDNINGSKIYGQLARPAKEGKRPAMLIVQWAGVYPLNKAWVVDRAKEGWLTLNIIAHDLPIDEPADFYAKQNAGPLKNYPSIGNDSRDTSYFLRMYLSCYRAADYLAGRDDWDGKTLVVCGGSQGGLQTIVTAAIHPKITAAMACVPAGCDLTGPVAGRACGWPNWYYSVQGKDAEKVRNAGRYFDVINFATRVKVPTLVGMGLVDETCPPAGVFAMYDQLSCPKEIVIMPNATHAGPHDKYYARMGAWQSALLKDQDPPVKQSQ